jgi:hypothetical protein
VDLLGVLAVLVCHYQLEVVAANCNVMVYEQPLALGMFQLFLSLLYYVGVTGRMPDIATDVCFDNA